MTNPLRSQSDDQIQTRSGGAEGNRPNQRNRFQGLRTFRDRVLGRSQREAQPEGVEPNRPSRSNPFRAIGRLLGRSGRGSEAARQAEPDAAQPTELEGDELPSYDIARAEREAERDRAAARRAEEQRNEAETQRKLARSAFTYDPSGGVDTRNAKLRAREIAKNRQVKATQSEGNLQELRRAHRSAAPPPPLPGYGEDSGLETAGSVSRGPEDVAARRRGLRPRGSESTAIGSRTVGTMRMIKAALGADGANRLRPVV